MIEVLEEFGRYDLAKVYVASIRGNKEHLVEFVESVQPPVPRDKKWVLIVSTLFGCPVGCKMCDAGGEYKGKLTSEEILAEIDYMVNKRFPDGNIPIPKFKIQFARMGDPVLNYNVLDVLRQLPSKYNAPGLLPSISTVAPKNSERFFDELLEIKNQFYKNGKFQLQFSVHTTDNKKRDELIPIPKMSFKEIADYGERFFNKSDKKVTLNFAMSKGYPVDVNVVRDYFNPKKFIIKLTPINPTEMAICNELISEIDAYNPSSADQIVKDFRSQGFDVILSIGEVEENKIGSNCGQYVTRIKKSNITLQSYL
jgi:23S rRNA (adenine2503-C2)-methyltransferase